MEELTLHPPDIVLINGPIYTGDEKHREFTGAAIAGGLVTALGEAEEIESLADEETRIVDLQGRSAIPGIVDSHNHLPTAGEMMADGVLLFDATDMDELKDLVGDKAQELAPGEWLKGAGWIENQFEEWRMPTRWDLDEAAPDNPVVLKRLFGMSVVNTRALELAGVDENTPDPEGGRIDRDAEGRVTGVLRDQATRLVERVVTEEDPSEQVQNLERYIETAASEYARHGITSLLDPGVLPLTMRAYQNVSERGDLPLRVNMMPVWHGLHPHRAEELRDRIDHLGVTTNFGDEWLRLGALKMAIDGGLGSKTLWMHEPFIDGTWSEASLRLDVGQLEPWFAQAHSAGWSVGIHCCGDRAQDVACRTFDRVMEQDPDRDVRHNIIHGYFPSEESLEIMRRRDIAVSAQPGFIWVEGDLYFDAVSEERLTDFTPLKTYAEKGIVVACNSDMCSAHYNPYWGIHAAMARRTSGGRTLGDREKVDRFEALRMFTYNGAYLMYWEDDVGSLEVGKEADVVVLSGDYGEIDVEDIRDLKAEMTILAGEVVYEK